MRFLIATFILCCVQIVCAQQFIYQGRYSSSADSTFTGHINVTARLLDSSLAIPLVWEETQDSVNVVKGVYQLALGASSDLGTLDFNKNYYLQLTVNNVLLSPSKLLFVPYAVVAQNVTGNVASTASIEPGLAVSSVNAFKDSIMVQGDSSIIETTSDNIITLGANTSAINKSLSLKEGVVLKSLNGFKDSLVIKAHSSISISAEGNNILLKVNENKLGTYTWSKDSSSVETDGILRGQGYKFEIWRGDLPTCNAANLGKMLLHTRNTDLNTPISEVEISICLINLTVYRWIPYDYPYFVF